MTGQSPDRGRAASRAARSASKATAPDTDSAVTSSEVPSRSARSLALPRRSSPTQRGQVGVGRAPGVQPGGHPRRDRVGAVGRDVDPAEGRPLPGEPGLLVRGQRGHRVGEHRVVPVLHPGRAGVVGLAGEVEAVAPVRPDLAGHPDRGAAVDEVAALLDVQLDEACPIAVQQPRPAELRLEAGASPSRRAGVRRRGPAARGPAPSVVAPVASREPRQASPNREPSSSANTATPIGRVGANPRSRSRSIAASAETTPSGPSYAPPSSTESRCEPVTTPPTDVRVDVSLGERRTIPVGQPPGERCRCRRPRRAGRGARTPRGTRPAARARRRRTAGGSSRRSTADRPRGARSRHICSKSIRHAGSMEFQTSYAAAGWSATTPTSPVDPAIVDRVLAHATRAPSAGFSQGWAFLVLDTPTTSTASGRRRPAEPSVDRSPTRWLRGMSARRW